MYQKQNKLVQFCYDIQEYVPYYVVLREIEDLMKEDQEFICSDKTQLRHAKKLAEKLEDLVKRGKKKPPKEKKHRRSYLDGET